MDNNLWVLLYLVCVLITTAVIIIGYKNNMPILGFSKYYDDYDYYDDHKLRNKDLLGISFIMGLVWPLVLANLILTLIVNIIKCVFYLIWKPIPRRFKDWLNEVA